MSDGEEEGRSCTWVHVVVFNGINVCLQACECVRAFMRGNCSTSVQDKCTLSLLLVSGSLSLSSFCLFSSFLQRD